MGEYKVIYSSDIHGNEVQYKKLVDYALKKSVDALIIGGDIAPKHFSFNDYIKGQRRFLEERFPEILSPLKNKVDVYLMMGNDDCKSNMDILEKYDGDLFYLIHNKRLKLNDSFDIVGYGFVPITPFLIKDWEKYDLSEVPDNMIENYENRKLVNYNFNGFLTFEGNWKKFKFTHEIEKKDSIQKDLRNTLFTQDPKKTVYVFHSPPDNTNLDIIMNNSHAGSMAERLFIEEHQPYLTLHGHIHETVKISGEFKHKIGETLCLASGNNNVGDMVALLEFDLNNIKDVERILI